MQAERGSGATVYASLTAGTVALLPCLTPQGEGVARFPPCAKGHDVRSFHPGQVALGCGYALAFTRVVGAASRIHAAVLARVLCAPKACFDTTP